MLTKTWETLSEIKERTGAAADDVIRAVQAAYKNGLAECKFDEVAGVKVTEFRLKY